MVDDDANDNDDVDVAQNEQHKRVSNGDDDDDDGGGARRNVSIVRTFAVARVDDDNRRRRRDHQLFSSRTRRTRLEDASCGGGGRRATVTAVGGGGGALAGLQWPHATQSTVRARARARARVHSLASETVSMARRRWPTASTRLSDERALVGLSFQICELQRRSRRRQAFRRSRQWTRIARLMCVALITSASARVCVNFFRSGIRRVARL